MILPLNVVLVIHIVKSHEGSWKNRRMVKKKGILWDVCLKKNLKCLKFLKVYLII